MPVKKRCKPYFLHHKNIVPRAVFSACSPALPLRGGDLRARVVRSHRQRRSRGAPRRHVLLLIAPTIRLRSIPTNYVEGVSPPVLRAPKTRENTAASSPLETQWGC